MELPPRRALQERQDTPVESEGFPENLGELGHEVLSEMDWPTLRTLFEDEIRRSGVTSFRNRRFADPDAVSISPDAEYTMVDTATGKIVLGMRGLYRAVEQVDTDQGQAFKNQVMSALIHEETHQAGYNNPRTMPKELLATLRSTLLNRPVALNNSGYAHDTAVRTSLTGSHAVLFNEAVTDLIAEDIYDAYCAQTGAGGGNGYGAGYLAPRAMVESFLLAVAHATEQPRDMVWKAIRHGYFSGLDLSTSRLGRLFDELALTELINSVRHARSYEDMEAAMEQMTLPDEMGRESQDRIRAGMEELMWVND